MAARRSCAVAAARVCAEPAGWDGGVGGAAGVKKGRAGNLGVRARGEGRGNLGRTLRLCGEDGADGVGPTGQRERGDAEAARVRWQVGRVGCAAGSGPVRGVGGRGRGEGVGGWARAVRNSTRAHELRAGARR